MPSKVIVATDRQAVPNKLKAPGFLVPMFKSPLILYRLGLGSLMGTRFLLLTHVGRKTGKVYRSVLAVLSFDKQTREIRAVAPWGASNWLKNIQARPALEVRTGSVHYVPVFRYLTPEEIATLFIQFRTEHPNFSHVVARIPGWNIDSTYEEMLALARTLHGIAFKPAGG